MPVPAPSPDARAVVTGASQNIGEALATELAARGHHLIVTARREEVLTALADQADRALRRHRRGARRRSRRPRRNAPSCAPNSPTRNVSILCANAGTATFGPVANLDVDGEKAQVQLNVLGVHDLVLAVLPGMVDAARGRHPDLRLGGGQLADPEQRDLRGVQGIRQHLQRVAARRGEAPRHPRHRAGARARCAPSCPTATSSRSSRG